MERKKYTAPKAIRVKLVVKNAILAVCHTSTNSTPNEEPYFNCVVVSTCYTQA